MYLTKLTLLITLLKFFTVLQFCTCKDTLYRNETLQDGDVLISKGDDFVFGFFSPANLSLRYVGIWYNKVSLQTVVWVANRDFPIYGTSGELRFDDRGNLVLHDKAANATVWSTNVSESGVGCRIFDSGNLVLLAQDSNDAAVVWQSFDYPTDTLLPAMKVGTLSREAGWVRYLTAWKSVSDPGVSDWNYRFDTNGSPQMILFKGKQKWWRTGPWNGYRWNGIPEQAPNFIFNTNVINNNDEITMWWGLLNDSVITRSYVHWSGFIRRATWHQQDRRWIEFWSVPKEPCDNYAYCGKFGNCNPYNAGVFQCTCVPGYEPRSWGDWYLRDGSGGCVKKRGNFSTCRNGEGFIKVMYAKVPDTSTAQVDNTLRLAECEQKCLNNCSCTAYSVSDINKGTGCITWHGDLTDTRVFMSGGQDLFVRVDSVELAESMKKSGGIFDNKRRLAALVTSLVLLVVVVVPVAYWLFKNKRKDWSKRPNSPVTPASTLLVPRSDDFDQTQNPNLPFFDFHTIIAATDNFVLGNLLGQGGFGSVYKGQLENGQEIAVKTLSKSSRQGVEEFKNEVRLISKLQHKNLVQLFGCCVHKEEKMLVYEYLPNKSLDLFIFDEARRKLLDWRMRFDIILGIARGLLYLHQDSRLKIIHRDLKASNVLLDGAMNPKISDFGMARIFGEDQTVANTNKVVGTHGYMSPEYAMDGLYSIKSDVFSFGVLTLEIISGRKNIDRYEETTSINLTGHVWDLWREGKALEIVDPSLSESYPINEVLKCIQIGLLCVQESPNDRPTMLEAIFMLNNETTLPYPNKPAFILKRRFRDNSSSPTSTTSVNYVSNTSVQGR